MNSVKLLVAPRKVILCPPLFVRVTLRGELSVFIFTDPKFNDDGLAAIPALAGAAKRLQVVSTTNKSRHTNPLFIIFICRFPLGAKNSTELGRVGGPLKSMLSY